MLVADFANIFWCCDSKTAYPSKDDVDAGRQSGSANVELAEDLLGLRTTLVGTIRKNKRDILQELQPCQRRQENSFIFAFARQLTLVCYVLRKGRAMIVLSSLHHGIRVSEEVHKKPNIIRIDQMVQTYSCKRKINRWEKTSLS